MIACDRGFGDVARVTVRCERWRELPDETLLVLVLLEWAK